MPSGEIRARLMHRSHLTPVTVRSDLRQHVLSTFQDTGRFQRLLHRHVADKKRLGLARSAIITKPELSANITKPELSIWLGMLLAELPKSLP